jgi:iron complex outermembrane recepter protein
MLRRRLSPFARLDRLPNAATAAPSMRDRGIFLQHRLLLLTGALCLPVTAHAQRTEENVVTQSGDAFGRSMGNERVGLYNSEDVRSFNPIDAGNARIEGLYFAQEDRVPNRVIEGNTIRVGISAQRILFPAPTGIVDYALTFAGDKAEAGVEIERGPFGGFAGSIEVKIPILGNLGIAGGVGGRNQVRPEGGSNKFRNFGAVLKWEPYDGAMIAGFGGGYYNADDEARPTIFPAGTALPPRIPRVRFLGQDWTARSNVSRTFGLITKLPLGPVRLESGLFRSSRRANNAFADILTGVTADGRAANRVIIADGNNFDSSLSGEMRLVHDWGSGDMRHRLAASIRGRDKEKLFGGTQRLSLGPSSVIAADPRPRPAITLGAEDKDQVSQLNYGVAYGLNWADTGSFDVSLSKARYRKDIDFASLTRPDISVRDNPWLWSATGSVILTNRLALYGGYVRGLEEAPIAPDIASNRNEAPPAIRTQQMDIGLRYAITPKLSLIAGLFSVKKPYFNLDPASRFRQLGDVDNRGIEISLAGELAPGWSLVSGTVLLDPTISGEAERSGQIGERPIGSITRRSILNLDWRTKAGKGAWSFDLALESLSSRVGNAANTLEAGARENVNLGTRYRFALGPYKALMRLQVTNIFNDYGWQISSSGGFTASNSRTWTLQLLADF